jgi:hypothetical protein
MIVFNMRVRVIFSVIFLFIGFKVFSQRVVNIPIAPDFTIITTQNDTLNLYKALSQGKTVVLDLFQSSCGPCQVNSPIIDSAYKLAGSGSGNILFWGISNIDDNQTLNQFALNNNITFPLAGIEGKGDSAVLKLEEIAGPFGYPTYAVICPVEKTMYWHVNNPTTYNGFNTYYQSCNSTGNTIYSKKFANTIVNIFPNPAVDYVDIQFPLADKANVKIELISSTGEIVRSLKQPFTGNDEFKYRMLLNNIQDGNYYLTVYEDGNLIFAGILIKNRK